MISYMVSSSPAWAQEISPQQKSTNSNAFTYLKKKTKEALTSKKTGSP